MSDDQADRLIAAIRAHELVLLGVVAGMLSGLRDPEAAAREMRQITGDKFADAVPSGKRDPERETRINQLSAHFVEQFWTKLEKGLARQRRG